MDRLAEQRPFVGPFRIDQLGIPAAEETQIVADRAGAVGDAKGVGTGLVDGHAGHAQQPPDIDHDVGMLDQQQEKSGSHGMTRTGKRRKRLTLASTASIFARAPASSFSVGSDWKASSSLRGRPWP